MADSNTKRMTVDVPADLYDAFFLKCVNAKPRVTMKERIVAFIAKETGRPVPKFVDKRKLTREQREKLQ